MTSQSFDETFPDMLFENIFISASEQRRKQTDSESMEETASEVLRN